MLAAQRQSDVHTPLYMQKSLEFRESSYVLDPKPDAGLAERKHLRKRDKGSATRVLAASEKQGALITHGNELFPRQQILSNLPWATLYPIGPGLINLGNTCFLNSILQCLTYCAPFANYLLSRDHSQKCRNQALCIFCEFERHVVHCLKGPRLRAICPRAIVGNLKAIAKHMKLGRQEDAHEFLRFLLDIMSRNALHGLAKDLDPKLKETTAVNQVFNGEFSSQITCTKCEATSETKESFMDICLDIRKADSIERAIKLFCAPEKLTGTNQYACANCKTKVDAEKRVLISRTPVVLTLQLKRFAYRGYGYDQKISKLVSFSEHLDLSPFTCNQASNATYSLNSVIVHSGHSCHSGHYICYVKAPNGIWHVMDDSSVHPVGLSTPLRQSAYMLFYTLDSSTKAITSRPTLYSPLPTVQKVEKQSEATATPPAAIPTKELLENIAKGVKEKIVVPSGKPCSKPVNAKRCRSVWVESATDTQVEGKRLALDKSLSAAEEEYDSVRPIKRKRKNLVKIKGPPRNPFQKHVDDSRRSRKSSAASSLERQRTIARYFKSQ